MVISVRFIVTLVNLARRFSRFSIRVSWRIFEWLKRNTANRGRVPDTGHPSGTNTSLEETIPTIDIRATTPREFGDWRYEKATPNFLTKSLLILAGHPSKLDFVPKGWKQFAQPEGQPYYHHERHHIVTENNVIDPSILRKVEKTYATVLLRARGLRAMDPSSTETFIDVQVDDAVPRYYLVDHKDCTLFWLSNVVSNDLGLDEAYSESHMATLRKSLYWSHVEFFPKHLPYPDKSEKRLISVLSQARLDGATCLISTAAYSPGDCQQYIKILKNFKKNDGYKVWAIARMWKDIYYNRFIHLHGHGPARLHRLARLRPHNTHTLPLVPKLLIAVLFFNAHQGNINSLEEIYVDKITYQQHWKAFLEDRLREWNTVTFMATVLWTVGVGLLQVSSSGTPPLRTLMLASTLCAMSSIVISLLHDRQHRRRAKVDDSSQALNYFSRHYDTKRGFLYLALLYSLPYVLLMWSLLLAALATLVSGINSGVGMSVGILGVILGCAIMFTILRWNMEGSVYDVISGQWRATCEQWKTRYLRLLGDAVRGQDPDTNPSARQGIAAAADSESPGETETNPLPPT